MNLRVALARSTSKRLSDELIDGVVDQPRSCINAARTVPSEVRILSMRYVAPEDQSKERAPDTVIHGRGNIVPIDVRKSLLDLVCRKDVDYPQLLKLGEEPYL